MIEQRDKLAACPFCGDERAVAHSIRDGQQVSCSTCGASAPSAHHGRDGDTRARAIAAWNVRTLPETAEGELARALAANIMAAIRRAKFPKDHAAEAHDEFEALVLEPMLRTALPTPKASDKTTPAPDDVLRERLQRTRDEYADRHEMPGLVRLLDDALAALSTSAVTTPGDDAGEVDGWRDIASAPKDGTAIDLWAAERERYANERVANCFWREGRWVHAATIFDDEAPDDLAPVFNATHWMPLPAPPDANSKSAASHTGDA